MKYIVMEIQTALDGTVGNLVTVYDNRDDAESAYYLILSSAVKSSLYMHTAMLFMNNGEVLMSRNYIHEPEPEPNPEPEEEGEPEPEQEP